MANRVQPLTIETTILVSTFNLSNVDGPPETLAVYRSSTSRANVALDGFLGGHRAKDLRGMAKPQVALI